MSPQWAIRAPHAGYVQAASLGKDDDTPPRFTEMGMGWANARLASPDAEGSQRQFQKGSTPHPKDKLAPNHKESPKPATWEIAQNWRGLP